MKTFEVGDRVRIIGDLVDHQRPETFINMIGVIAAVEEIPDFPSENEYRVSIENLSMLQNEYLVGYNPFFYEDELELYTDEKA